MLSSVIYSSVVPFCLEPFYALQYTNVLSFQLSTAPALETPCGGALSTPVPPSCTNRHELMPLVKI
jgi:hypothetical protein